MHAKRAPADHRLQTSTLSSPHEQNELLTINTRSTVTTRSALA
jgi:hypothetical protein